MYSHMSGMGSNIQDANDDSDLKQACILSLSPKEQELAKINRIAGPEQEDSGKDQFPAVYFSKNKRF